MVYVVLAYIGKAYMVMTYMEMVCIIMAYIVMAYLPASTNCGARRAPRACLLQLPSHAPARVCVHVWMGISMLVQ